MIPQSCRLLGVALTLCFQFVVQPALAASPANPETLRRTLTGEVVGYVSTDNTYAWRGIPFAEPPVRALRWRAPQNPRPWAGVRPALEYTASCSQPADPEVVWSHYGNRLSAKDYLQAVRYTGSEDCLYLNIDTPRFPGGKVPTGRHRLPVMVYFHGGGNITGAGMFPGVLAGRENVITVAPNYRLGHFGWFTHSALRAEVGSDEDRSGNYGTLDQIQALRWVQKNISAFGGDPGNVTIFGISAGGMAGLALLSSPKAKGLFQKAIPMSGVTSTRTIAQASEELDGGPHRDINASSGELLLRLLMADGKAHTREQAREVVAKMRPEAVADYLRGKSFSDFNQADALIADDRKTGWPSLPIADGAVIPIEGIGASFKHRDHHNRVPVMIGNTRDEEGPLLLADGYFADVVVGPQGPEHHIKNPQEYRLAQQYMSLLYNADGSQERAEDLARVRPGEIFAYQLAWDDVLPWPGPDHEPRGAIHSQDLALIFGMPPVTEMTDGNFRWLPPVTAAGISGYREVAGAMMSYWAEFAYTGRPGKGRRGELPEWKAWNPSPNGPKYMVLDSTDGGGFRMSTQFVTKASVLDQLLHDVRLPTLKAKCDLLHTLYTYSTNAGRIKGADYSNFAGRVCVSPSDNEAEVTSNPAFDFMVAWIGGQWRIDAQSNDGHPFRARSVYGWGPGKKFIVAETFISGDNGTESLLCKNIFAANDDHVVNYGFASDGSISIAPMTFSAGTLDSIWTSEGSTMRQTGKFIGPDKAEWQLSSRQSHGGWKKVVAGVWVRE